MNEWLDNFQLMGVGLNEGEKTLMRMAMNKERERIIDLINDSGSRNYLTEEQCLELIDLINGHNIPSRFRDISNGE